MLQSEHDDRGRPRQSLVIRRHHSASPAGAERGERARAVLDAVFPDGLRFVNVPDREQWAESKRRLAKLGEAEAGNACHEHNGLTSPQGAR